MARVLLSPPRSSALDPMPASPLEPTASDAACARAACASADAKFVSRAQLGGADCESQMAENLTAAGNDGMAVVVPLVFVALLLRVLVAFVIAVDAGHRGDQLAFSLRRCKLHVAAWRFGAVPRQPRGRVWPRAAAAALRPRARAGRAQPGRALRRLAGRGAPRVRWRAGSAARM